MYIYIYYICMLRFVDYPGLQLQMPNCNMKGRKPGGPGFKGFTVEVLGLRV